MIGLNVGIGLRARMIAGGGSSGPSNVLPVDTWRVPISAVTATGTSNNTSTQTNLLASPTNKDLPLITVAANNTAVLIFDIGEISSPGAVLFYTTRSGSPTVRTVTVEYSTDGVSYEEIPHTPFETVTGTPNADQLVFISPRAAGKIRFSYSGGAATHGFSLQINQLQVDPYANDIYAVAGMSITMTSIQSAQLADQVRQKFPTRDPIFFNIARSGAQPQDMLTQQFQGIWEGLDFVKRGFVDIGPNNFLTGNGPYSSLSEPEQDDYLAHAMALYTWAQNEERVLTFIGPPFVSNDEFDAGGATNINQESVVEDGENVDISNQENGTRPFIQNLYKPVMILPTGMADSWDDSYDAPMFDGYQSSLLAWDFIKQILPGMTENDGVHPAANATSIYRSNFVDAYEYHATGDYPGYYLERKVTAAEPMVSESQKNRLWLGAKSIFDTTTGTAARQTLEARINNLSTTWAEPSGQTAPTTLANMLVSYDFDDMNTLWSDDAGTVPARDFNLVRRVSDKTANHYDLTQDDSAATPPYHQPQFELGDIAFDKGLSWVTTSSGQQFLENLNTEVYSSLDGAGTNFLIGWIAKPSSKSTASILRQIWLFQGTGGLQARYAASSLRVQIIGTAVIGTEPVLNEAPLNEWRVYILSYDGTTLQLRQNGVQTISATYNKPSWTATGFRVGNTNYLGKLKGFHMIVGSWDTTVRTALENRLLAQIGI